MGILVRKYEDNEVFKDAYEEAQRIIRISDEVRITLDEVKAEASPVSEMKESEEEIILPN
jgi:tRNA(Ser,Leu) C12 N-acetylase TAN1